MRMSIDGEALSRMWGQRNADKDKPKTESQAFRKRNRRGAVQIRIMETKEQRQDELQMEL